jgi:hypothetical protein
MSNLPGTGHWADPAWRMALEDQHSDQLEHLRILLRRRIAWLRNRTGRHPLDGELEPGITQGQVSAALRTPDRAAELEFYRSSPEAVAMSQAATALDCQVRERAQGMAAAGNPFPLDRIARVFRLDDVSRSVLMLALAPELDAAFERAFAYAHDDATRRHATPALALALFGDAGGMRRAVDPDGPLFRWGLVRPDGAAPAAVRPLRLERRMVWYLQGLDHDDGDDDAGLSQVPPVPVPAEIGSAAELVAGALTAAGGGASSERLLLGGAPVVNLVGGTRGEADALAAAVGTALGLAVHAAPLEAAGDPRTTRARLERESVLRETLLLVRLEDEDRGAEERLLERVESIRTPVVLWSPYPVRVTRAVVAAPVPRAAALSARAMWRGLLGDASDDMEASLDRIVHHFHLDPDGVVRVAAAAAATARLRRRPVSHADLWDACRQHGRRRLGGLADRIEPSFRWDDIVLPADGLRQLEEIVAQVRHRGVVYEQWRFGDKLVRGRGVTALFAGPSGTGKTMAAEVLAGELELDLYRIDLAGVVNKYIGETEKNLRRIFEAAEESGAILFFDEADALFGKRTEVRDSHDRYANIEVNYLLQRMESYTGLAILATNRRTSLDRAFLRRLRFLVDFPFPTAASRLRIWQRAIPDDAPVAGIDFPALARMELAGGNIRSIALNAAFLAAADGRVITMEHLRRAADRELAKIDQAPRPEANGVPAVAVSS